MNTCNIIWWHFFVITIWNWLLLNLTSAIFFIRLHQLEPFQGVPQNMPFLFPIYATFQIHISFAIENVIPLTNLGSLFCIGEIIIAFLLLTLFLLKFSIHAIQEGKTEIDLFGACDSCKPISEEQ